MNVYHSLGRRLIVKQLYVRPQVTHSFAMSELVSPTFEQSSAFIAADDAVTTP
jgi:hypothetical protein